MIRSPRRTPFTTISSRLSDEPTGAATGFVDSPAGCASAGWWAVTIAHDTRPKPRIHDFIVASLIVLYPLLLLWHQQAGPARAIEPLCKNRAQWHPATDKVAARIARVR